MSIKYSSEVLSLADSVGSFIEYWGFRKIHGKVWVLIYLSKEPIDAGVLIEHLHVTKGLISTTIKTLLDYELIEEIDFGDNRSKYYQAKLTVSDVIVNVLKNRENLLLEEIKERFYKLSKGESENIDPEKLKNLNSIIKLGDVLLKGIIKFRSINLSPWRKL